MSERSRPVSFLAALAAMLLVLLLAIPAGAAHHKTDDKTDSKTGFSVYHGPAGVLLTTAGSDGHQLGDVRVTSVPTTSADGMPLGRMDATLITTAVDVPAEGDQIRISNLVFAFGTDGKSQIFVGGTAVYPADGPTIAIDAVTVRPIIGGSGRFAGASGTAQTKHLEDDSWVHTFRLERDGPRARTALRTIQPQRMRGFRVYLRDGLRAFMGERRERGFARGHGRDRGQRGDRHGRMDIRAFGDTDDLVELKAAEAAAKAAYAEAKATLRAAEKEAKKAAKEAAKEAKRAEKAAADEPTDQVEIIDEPDADDDAPEEVGITRIDLGIASPGAAPGEQLGLWQYTIPARSELVPHTHAGTQIAYIARGELAYTVFEGEGSIIHSDGTTTTIGPGTYVLKTGDSVIENPELVHQGANRTDDEVVIIAATLYGEGEPLAIPAEVPAGS